MSEKTEWHSASFGARATALAIDFALLAVMHSFVFLLLAGRLLQELIHLEPLAVLSMYSSFLLVFAMAFVFLHMIYFTIFHAWSGQTVGKLLMGIRVIARGNTPIAPSVAFLRWTGYILSAVPLAAGFLWAAVDKDHCAWHDWLAETRVVSTEMT